MIRTGEDRFLLVTGTAFGTHDRRWIERHAPRDGSVARHDVTASRACFGLWGPRARDILQPLTETSLAHAGFPYMSARQFAVGDVPCLAVRVTYVGELGWELYCPTEYGAACGTRCRRRAGAGLVPCGYRAIDALRLEKGYRAWATDITPDTTPDEAGLGFAVKPGQGRDFIGRDGGARQPGGRPPADAAGLPVLDDPRAIGLGSEPVRRTDGEVLGRVTTGGYGFAVGASIAWAWVPAEAAEPGTRLEVDIFGDWVGAEVARRAAVRPGGRTHPLVVERHYALGVKGRIVIVTGGASGMGAACARLLSDAGAAVVIVDRDGVGAANVAAGIGATVVAGDVTDSAFCDHAVAETLERHGQLDQKIRPPANTTAIAAAIQALLIEFKTMILLRTTLNRAALVRGAHR